MSKWKYPVEYIGITQINHYGKSMDFGWFDDKTAPIYSIGDGTVKKIMYDTGGGNNVFIEHEGAIISNYGHLSEYFIKEGDFVKQGQVIGKMGNTGTNANGYHLHFGLYKNAQLTGPSDLDPFEYLYVYPDQVVGKSTQATYKKFMKFIENPDVLGNPLYLRYVHTNDEGLDIRDLPGNSAATLGNLGAGTPVYVYQIYKNWSRIGINQWIYSSYLTQEEPPTYLVTNKNGTYVRTSPSSTGTIKRKLSYGKTIVEFACSIDDEWIMIGPNEQLWVSIKDISGICLIPYDPNQ